MTKILKSVCGQEILLDDEDFVRLSNYRYYVCRNKHIFTISRRVGEKTVVLSHDVLGSPKIGQQVDHINGNGLDNRKCNLRFCTKSQNQFNRPKRKAGTSKYKGVSLFKNGKWTSKIMHNRKPIWLGYFNTEEEAAALAYNNAAMKIAGEFAYLNKIGKPE